MALVQISPQAARVSWDRLRQRPAAVRIGDRRLQVTALDAVRNETAAYPADRGPRITFLLATDQGPASLVYDSRRRRWYVEAMDHAA